MSNKKQTAMQLLIAEIDEQAKTCPRSHRKFYIYCKMLSVQKLELEKQQIINHHTWLLSGVMHEESAIKEAEQYYKETYEK